LAGERAALDQARAALADAQAEGAATIAGATQAQEAAAHAQRLAEARLVESQRVVAQLESRMAEATAQRDALAIRVDRLEDERARLQAQLQAERAAAATERETQAAHVRAVEDRAHAEVDRARQDA